MNIVNSDVENESNYTNSLNTNKWINTTLLKPAKTDKELMAIRRQLLWPFSKNIIDY